MDFKQFHQNILKDVKTELSEEFDRNFERKAFFDKSWTKNKLINRKGSQMARTNNLRRGYQSRIEGDSIVWTNSMPYALIHNEGGEITVTAKMKKYFWAKYMEAGKKGIEAEQFKAMALKKVGSKITIPERRVIGNHPEVHKAIERVVNNHMKELNDLILRNLKP